MGKLYDVIKVRIPEKLKQIDLPFLKILKSENICIESAMTHPDEGLLPFSPSAEFCFLINIGEPFAEEIGGL